MNKNANVVTKKSITTQVNGISSKSKKPVTVIDHNKRSHNEKLTSDSAASPLLVGHSAGKINSRDKYAVPELLSILKISKRLEHLTLTENQTIRDFNDMTPRTKNIATEGALKKLNFVSHKPIYKNLLPINVNDSVLEVRPRSNDARRTKSKAEQYANKDPEPNLNDYLVPLQSYKQKHKINFADIDSDDDEQTIIQRRHFSKHYQNIYQFYEKYLSK